MIQIYSPGNTNFKQNGDMTLFPEICEASSELGGAWTLEITHPIDEESRWKYIEKEAVLSVPTHMGENQLYRIDKITGKTDAEISAKAYPIFYDSADEVFLMDKRPTDKTAQMALDILTEGTKYSGQSDISGLNTAYFVRRNLMDCICGEDTPSFIGTWGGEPLYENYKVIINKRAGGDRGAEVRYGKNIVGVNVTEDMSEVVTRIVPVAYNGRLLSTLSVDSPLINNYAKVYTKEIKFEDVRYFEDIEEGTDTVGLILCNSQEELDAALLQKCNEQFEAGIDLFKVTIDIDMVSLENTEEYKDFKDLVKIGLGDDVACYHTRLGIQTKARAIKLVWDCITNSAKEVVLGDYQYNFLKEWSSQMSQVKKDVGTLFDQLENPQSSFRVMMQNTIDSMAASIAGYDGGNMIITQNEAGKPNGIMIMDTDSKDTAKKILWFNLNGITYSSNGADGPFNTVWSFEQGGFVADWILVGTMLADRIKGGTLTLGGVDNGDGICTVSDAEGTVIIELSKDGISINKGVIDIKSLPSNYYPILLENHTGDILKLGAGNAQWKDSLENTTVMISGYTISLGKNTSDTAFSVDVSLDPIFGITSKPTYEYTTTDSANVHVDSVGMFYRSSSSSERYKKDITEELSTELDPKHLYNVPVKMFKYKEGYLKKEDRKNGKDIIGFIVEDFEKSYPAAVQYVNGVPEMWNANILIPAMMKLIQEQNERIKRLEGNDVNL